MGLKFHTCCLEKVTIFNIIGSLQTLRSFRSPALNEIRYGFRNVVQYGEVVEPLPEVFWSYAVLPDFIGDCIFITLIPQDFRG